MRFGLDLGALLGALAAQSRETGAEPNPYFDPETGKMVDPSTVPFTDRNFDATKVQLPFAPPASRGFLGLSTPRDISGEKNAAFLAQTSLENTTGKNALARAL